MFELVFASRHRKKPARVHHIAGGVQIAAARGRCDSAIALRMTACLNYLSAVLQPVPRT